MLITVSVCLKHYIIILTRQFLESICELLNDFKSVTVLWGNKSKQAVLGRVENGKVMRYYLVIFVPKLEMLSIQVCRWSNVGGETHTVTKEDVVWSLTCSGC